MTDHSVTVDLTKYIEIRLVEERPHIRGRRIPVAMIAHRMQANRWTVAETAADFSLSESEVLAALLYYQEHQAEIEQQEREESVEFDTAKRIHGN